MNNYVNSWSREVGVFNKQQTYGVLIKRNISAAESCRVMINEKNKFFEIFEDKINSMNFEKLKDFLVSEGNSRRKYKNSVMDYLQRVRFLKAGKNKNNFLKKINSDSETDDILHNSKIIKIKLHSREPPQKVVSNKRILPKLIFPVFPVNTTSNHHILNKVESHSSQKRKISFCLKNTPIEIPKTSKSSMSSDPRATKVPKSPSPPTKTIPKYFIRAKNGFSIIEHLLRNLGWSRTYSTRDKQLKIVWVECKSFFNYNDLKEGQFLVNHVQNCELISNKANLLLNLTEYSRILETEGHPQLCINNFIPKTLIIRNSNDLKSFMEYTYSKGQIWICKPANLNQGIGIRLVRSLGEVESLYNSQNKFRQKIFQRYIEKPLLLEDKKFDIRAYMVIASTKPFLVLFNEGYVRLSSRPYNVEDGNLITHLTNQFMQKKNPNYKEIKESTVWSIEKLNEYINEVYWRTGQIGRDWAKVELKRKMESIALFCFKSVKDKIKANVGIFEIYGLDFLIGEDFQVFLLEINTNPSFCVNCKILEEVIPEVIKESVEISIDCFDKKISNKSLMPIKQLNKLRVIYSEE